MVKTPRARDHSKYSSPCTGILSRDNRRNLVQGFNVEEYITVAHYYHYSVVVSNIL